MPSEDAPGTTLKALPFWKWTLPPPWQRIFPPQKAHSFAEEDLDAEDILVMHEADFEEMGVTDAKRRKDLMIILGEATARHR